MSETAPTENKLPEAAFAKADLPGLSQAGSKIAMAAQRRYITFIRLDLGILVVVTGLSLEPLQHIALGTVLVPYLRILLLMVGFLLAGALATTRPDRQWYDARWIAETSKSLAWRYLAGNNQTEDQFRAGLEKLLQEKEALVADLAVLSSALPSITPRMQKMRQQPLTVRSEFYQTQRLQDQRDWYRRKAHTNRKAESGWYAAILACQFIAAVWALFLLTHLVSANAIELFTILATAFLSWAQLRQHQQLAQSYGLAAHRLGMLAQEGKHLDTEDKLQAFVEKSEQVMSGENSSWYAHQHRE